jgi:hypothetical protein
LMNYLLSFPKRHPFIFGVGVTTIKTGGVDFCIQKYVEKTENIDWTRVTVFSVFGMSFSGAWQHFLFVKAMPSLFPNAVKFIEKPLREKLRDRKGLKEVFFQNFIENGINNPLLYFPIFYNIQEFLNNGFEHGSVKRALSRYGNNFKEDMFAMWSVWVPAQLINFGFSPLWLRVPFVAFVSALWTAYVSISRGKFDGFKHGEHPTTENKIAAKIEVLLEK